MYFFEIIDIDAVADSDITATSFIESFNDAYLEERLYDAVGGYETYLEWFRRTRRGDTQALIAAELASEYTSNGGTPGEVPLGFRLKSTGVSIASVLDQITYLDPNDHLPNDYFGVESNFNNDSSLGHEFNVGSIV